ncbi:TrlF family AAA-like ATPase [Paenibacillus sp. KR2-11]|uniref:TrlF family AAA-like ATPase n=1 Tax=Paenibacillus sp. KR2-11 TaxID=3385500 RepID=UPI0038FD2C6A
MNYKSYDRGSEWRKWDLHTHTPLDVEWLDTTAYITEEEKKRFAEQYVAFAVEQGLSVIAITDHNFCDSLDQLFIPYIQEEAKRYNLTILPGFEITANAGSGVHLLVVFPEKTLLSTIKSIVDQLFYPGQQKIAANAVPHSSKSIDEMKEIIGSAGLEPVFIFAHADRDKGVLHNHTISGQIRIDLWKKPYLNICQLSKSKSEYSNNFIANVISGSDLNFKREMTYIVASDCRSITIDQSVQGRNHLGEKFVWVKADPTIDGLKQTIYEPDRVRVQEENPQDDYNKPYFSKITIEEPVTIFPGKQVKFNKGILNLNSNLVTIIGGRGTGKSLILDAIGKTFGNGSARARNIHIEQGFSVAYTKEDDTVKEYRINEENNLDYLHVHQGHVKEIVEDPHLLDLEIKQMLGIVSDISDEVLDTEMKSIIDRITKFRDWFEETGIDGQPLNKKSYHESQKKKYEDLLNNITVESNKELIMNFSTSNAEISTRVISIEDLRKIKLKVQSFVSEITSDINMANQNQYAEVVPHLELEEFVLKLDDAITSHQSRIDTLQEENEVIRRRFIEIGIREDISTLLNKVEEYQLLIEKFKKKIDEITEREKQYPELILKRTELVDRIKERLSSQVEKIEKSWEQLKQGKAGWSQEQTSIINLLLRDIEISAEIYFDKEAFYDTICNYLSKTKFKTTKSESSEERIRRCISVNTYEEYLALISNLPVIEIGDEHKLTLEDFIIHEGYFVKSSSSDFIRSLFESQHTKKYVKAITKIKYKGKEPAELSVGQRGTLYICLKLATNPFSTPFLFDQPEDDLDNQFIVSELIPIFRALKQYRQIIIATHNANLVVNADAEQVIVAGNAGEILSYVSGSLENTFKNPSIIDPLKNQGIREHVCDILEGGERAFEKRERKYGFK